MPGSINRKERESESERARERATEIEKRGGVAGDLGEHSFRRGELAGSAGQADASLLSYPASLLSCQSNISIARASVRGGCGRGPSFSPTQTQLPTLSLGREVQ